MIIKIEMLLFEWWWRRRWRWQSRIDGFLWPLEPPAAGLGGKSLSCSFVNNCFDGGREIEELKFEMSQKHHTPEIFFFGKCEVEADSIWEWCRTGYFSKWWSWSSWNQTIGLLGHVPSVPTMLFINWLVLFKVVIITSVNSEISCEKCDHVILLVYQSVGS